MPAPTTLTIRPASVRDRSALAALTHAQERVHSHLDWKPVDHWLGTQPFLLAERAARLVGALACPPDPEDTAWLRLLTLAERGSENDLWNLMLSEARLTLSAQGVTTLAALSVDGWIDSLCLSAGFVETHAVVVLRREARIPTTAGNHARAGVVRMARPEDHQAIKLVDTAAFNSPWQMGGDLLDLAISQAQLLTVCEGDGQIVGYQLTTPNHMSAHLARLAVLPGWQGQGIGAGLLQHLIDFYDRRHVQWVTVNTQNTNAASLRLYQRFGFVLTGARYPVFQLQL